MEKITTPQSVHNSKSSIFRDKKQLHLSDPTASFTPQRMQTSFGDICVYKDIQGNLFFKDDN